MTINRTLLSKISIANNPMTGKLLDAVTKESTGQNMNKCFKIITENQNNTLSVLTNEAVANHEIIGEYSKGDNYSKSKACVDAINKSVYTKTHKHTLLIYQGFLSQLTL